MDLDEVTPDLLTGYAEAGRELTWALRDAERRIKQEQYEDHRFAPRMGDVRLHIQYRQQYRDPRDKARIIRAADRVLNETLKDSIAKREPAASRFNEALAAMAAEDERIFVLVLIGNICHLVYWNWNFGYSIHGPYGDGDSPDIQTLHGPSRSPGIDDSKFVRAVNRRSVACPELARHAYGNLVRTERTLRPSEGAAPAA